MNGEQPAVHLAFTTARQRLSFASALRGGDPTRRKKPADESRGKAVNQSLPALS
jgi:hypothetical protein